MAFSQWTVDVVGSVAKLLGMTDLRCMIGNHAWRTYRSGTVSGAFYTRQWCPRCRADSILRNSTRVDVTPGVWINREPPAAGNELL